jgi:[ribosomal protein S18]-alanine N-acetyltransferase
MSAAIRTALVPQASQPPVRDGRAGCDVREGRALRIERSRKQQFSRLLRIESECFGEDSYREEFFRKLCEDHHDLLFVARYGREIAGYVMGEQLQDRAEVISLAVNHEYRGRGIGRQLMHAVLMALRKHGEQRVFLMVRADNQPAINLYRSLGFRRVRRVPCYYHDGQDAVRMRLELV